MLVLSRKIGASVYIGDDIKVTVVRIGPNAVRLGIEAPQALNITREELLETVSTKRPIQASESDIEDLGVRVIDPLNVAEAYE